MTPQQLEQLLPSLNGLSGLRLVIPVTEADEYTLVQKVRDAGFFTMLQRSPLNDLEIVVTDRMRDEDSGPSWQKTPRD